MAVWQLVLYGTAAYLAIQSLVRLMEAHREHLESGFDAALFEPETHRSFATKSGLATGQSFAPLRNPASRPSAAPLLRVSATHPPLRAIQPPGLR